MNNFLAKNKILVKRRSLSINTDRLSRQAFYPPPGAAQNNKSMRPMSTTTRSHLLVAPRTTNKTSSNVSKPIPPPVAPRTIIPHTSTVKQTPPVPAERTSLNKNNKNHLAEGQITALATEVKSVKANLLNDNNTNRILSDQKIPVKSTISLSTPYTPGLCGLINMGNTCYMNSALQCLSNIPKFTQWARDKKDRLLQRKQDIIYVYTSLIKLIWSGENNSIYPREIKEIVSRSVPIFSDYGQKDSHEFMNSLLNALEQTNDTSIISNLFHIHTRSQVTCLGCHFIDTADETTTFLALPLPQKSLSHEDILLEDLIHDYCQEDQLDGLYYCRSCLNYAQAKQKTILCSPVPRVLIIQLKRFPFDGTSQKIDTFVRYQLQHQNLISNNDIYQLCAVSSHAGSLASGHYTTLARNDRMKEWYLFNDSQIEKINSNRVVTRNAYVLIYLKSE